MSNIVNSTITLPNNMKQKGLLPKLHKLNMTHKHIWKDRHANVCVHTHKHM